MVGVLAMVPVVVVVLVVVALVLVAVAPEVLGFLEVVGSEIDLAEVETTTMRIGVGELGTTKSTKLDESTIDVQVLADSSMFQLLSTGDGREKMKLRDEVGQLGNQRLKVALLMIADGSQSLQEEERGTRDGDRVAKFQKNLDIQ
jgi:hypothetical protein